MNKKQKVTLTMFRIMAVMFPLILMLWGCGDAKKDKKTEEKREQEKNWKVSKNESEEDIILLSLKYELNPEELEQIISEYDKMVFGYSMVGLLK